MDTPRRRKDRILKMRYGIRIEDFDKLMLQQNSCCFICSKFMPHPQIDHDHATQRVRCLLCRRCNNMVGYIEKFPELVQPILVFTNYEQVKERLDRSTGYGSD